MIEVRQKKLVTTRKVHKCYFCREEIAKGKKAVNVKGKEDERYINLYLHVPCNIEARKLDLFEEGNGHSPALKNDVAETKFPF